ncbi:MAG: hypothetical protein QXO32_05905 [Candidatus Bathyarchaeia archaeon]
MDDKDAVQSLAERLEILDKEAKELKASMDSLLGELKEHLEKRDKLNGIFQERKVKISELKEKRDRLNQEVKRLKSERDEARKEANARRLKLRELKAEYEKLRTQVKGNFQKAREELEKLEWSVQTNPYSASEERKILAKIAQLEEELNAHKKGGELLSRIKETVEEVKAFNQEAEHKHGELMKRVEESEKYHREMMSLVSDATNLKKMADEEHQRGVEVKAKLKKIQQRYFATLLEIKATRKRIKEIYRRTSLEKGEELERRIVEEASEKLKQGGKLTFEEFKVLLEKGRI